MIPGLENRIVYDVVDVIDGRVKPEKAFVRDKRGLRLSLLPPAQTKNKEDIDADEFSRMVEVVRDGFDYVLIDGPAGIERGFRLSTAPASEALIVTNPEVSSVRDAERIIRLLESMGKDDLKLVSTG